LIELQALFPIGGKLIVKGPQTEDPAEREALELRVRALTAREIVQQLARIAQIVNEVDSGKKSYYEIANDYFEDACALLALATMPGGTTNGLDVDAQTDVIANLDGGDFLRAWKTFLGANADFFKEAADLLVGATAKKIKAMISDGRTPSSISANTESPTP